MAAGDLTTLASVKLAMEDDSSTAADDLIKSLITAASRAIHSFTGREFAAIDANPSARLVDIGGYDLLAGTSGIPVGDLSAAPSAVVVRDAYGDTAHTFTVADDVVALPLVRRSFEPVTHLRIRPGVFHLASTHLLSVTGSWGWPSIPPDVAHAAVITVRSWMRSDAQGIAAFDDGFGRAVNPTPSGGWMLPMAAKQILNPYRLLGVA